MSSSRTRVGTFGQSVNGNGSASVTPHRKRITCAAYVASPSPKRRSSSFGVCENTRIASWTIAVRATAQHTTQNTTANNSMCRMRTPRPEGFGVLTTSFIGVSPLAGTAIMGARAADSSDSGARP